jgi:hypothetical protein
MADNFRGIDPPTGESTGGKEVARSGGRARWVAILTGAVSILIGVLYLLLVTVLDRPGPLLPPPPEALAGSPPGVAAAAAPSIAAAAPPHG